MFDPISIFVYIVSYQSKYANTIENEEKITFHPVESKDRIRPFAVEKSSSHKKPVLQVVFRFSWEIFTL